MCKCSNCSEGNLLNFYYINNMTDELKTLENPIESARKRLWGIVTVVLGLLRYAGLFVLGIIIGMGIVLKDPLPSKEQQIKIAQLEKENTELKNKINKVQPDSKNKDAVITKEAFVIN
jgi:hypothetical protein